MSDSSLELAIKKIEFARAHTNRLLADIDDGDWFRQPAEGVTHVAWQVAHLAMAEYGLALFRMRGRLPEDLALMPGPFRRKYSKGSAPDPDPANNPSPAEIRAVFDRVHRQVILELPSHSPSALGERVDEPYAVSPTRLGGLY
ncbi:MAG: DinB family protein, partial [Planctomycetes bacterium]|nr:DinB family protein [Planctomycetota bacterium]